MQLTDTPTTTDELSFLPTSADGDSTTDPLKELSEKDRCAALRSGSLVNLRALTGYKESQLSAWFSDTRKMSDRVYQRLGQILRLDETQVRKVVKARQREVLRASKINTRLRHALNCVGQ